MKKNEQPLDPKAIAEADKATAKLLEVHGRATTALLFARSDYVLAWQYHYERAIKALEALKVK